MADTTDALRDKWYCVDVNGMLTLCASKADAERVAKQSTRDYPRGAPYIVTRIAAVATPTGSAEGDAGGRITGWRLADGVKVFNANAYAPGAPDQELVRYTDYAALQAEVARLQDGLRYSEEAFNAMKAMCLAAEARAEAAEAEAARLREKLEGTLTVMDLLRTVHGNNGATIYSHVESRGGSLVNVESVVNDVRAALQESAHGQG